MLSACGDKDVDKPMITPATQQQAQGPAREASESGYKVIETFDVGQTVFVRSMDVDEKTNTIWIGTTVGALEVDIASRNMKNTYTRENGLANEYVFSMMADSQGGKWFGTNGGGVSYLKDGKWKTWFPMHGLADYWVYSFTEQANGTVWIGTWYGLNTYDPKTGKFHTYLKELVNEWVYGLDVDSNSRSGSVPRAVSICLMDSNGKPGRTRTVWVRPIFPACPSARTRVWARARAMT